jgi:Ca-activated chloride channel homolog
MAMFLKKTSHSIRILLIVVLILLNGSILFTQDASQKPFTISKGVDLVNVFATVRDKKGTYITKLGQEDFTLKEDGRAQPISNFTREVDLPLTIGMIVDASPSMQGVATQLQIASLAFFKKMIRPEQDGIFIMKFRDVQRGGRSMTFDGSIELVQDLTTDPVKIEKAAKLIAWDGIAGSNWDAEFQTMLADSVIFATTKKLAGLPPGRRALIVLGDGYHTGNHAELAIQCAQESDTQIYTVHIYDPNFGASSSGGGGGFGGMGGGFGGFGGGFGGMGGGMQAANDTVYATNLQILASKTGGSYYEYNGKKSLDNIYAEIEEELRGYYSLGYAPAESKNPGCRKLEVKVKEGLTVHAREKYCPPGSSGGKSTSKQK